MFVCLFHSDGDKALPVVHSTMWILAAYVLIPRLDGEHHQACNEKEFNLQKASSQYLPFLERKFKSSVQ